jgi:hypothetical protein
MSLDDYLESIELRLEETSEETKLFHPLIKKADASFSVVRYNQLRKVINDYRVRLIGIRDAISSQIFSFGKVISAEQTNVIKEITKQTQDLETDLMLLEIELNNNQLKGGLQYLARNKVQEELAKNPEAVKGLDYSVYKSIINGLSPSKSLSSSTGSKKSNTRKKKRKPGIKRKP